MKQHSRTPATSATARWLLLGVGIGVSVWVQQKAKEHTPFPDPTLMHAAWLILFATLAALACTYRGLMRWVMLTFIGTTCLLFMLNWYHFRNQCTVSLGGGVYQIVNL